MRRRDDKSQVQSVPAHPTRACGRRDIGRYGESLELGDLRTFVGCLSAQDG